MNRLVMACAAAAVLLIAPAAGAETTTAAPPAPAGERLLQTSIVIDAPVSRLWKAFTDPAEYRRWAGGVAAVDLRVGGSFEASYDPNGRIGDPGTSVTASWPSRRSG